MYFYAPAYIRPNIVASFCKNMPAQSGAPTCAELVDRSKKVQQKYAEKYGKKYDPHPVEVICYIWLFVYLPLFVVVTCYSQELCERLSTHGHLYLPLCPPPPAPVPDLEERLGMLISDTLVSVVGGVGGVVRNRIFPLVEAGVNAIDIVEFGGNVVVFGANVVVYGVYYLLCGGE